MYKCNYDEIVKKLKSGEKLTESELETLVYEGNEIAEIEGDSYRWTQSVQTIINIEGELWAIDWQRGLTEYQESEFYDQPYRVKKRERQITIIEYVQM